MGRTGSETHPPHAVIQPGGSFLLMLRDRACGLWRDGEPARCQASAPEAILANSSLLA